MTNMLKYEHEKYEPSLIREDLERNSVFFENL